MGRIVAETAENMTGLVEQKIDGQMLSVECRPMELEYLNRAAIGESF